jgi:hypothetical protein
LGRGPDGRVMHDNLLYTHVEKKCVSPISCIVPSI